MEKQMKNFKTIAIMSAFTLLCTSTNIQTMGYWKKIPKNFKGSFNSFAQSTLLFTYLYFHQSVQKKNTEPFEITPTQRQNIEARFNKYRPCTELNILKDYTPKGAAEIKGWGSKAKLYLPKDFFIANSPDEQDAIIAHEATHFSQSDNTKASLIVTATYGLTLVLSDRLHPSFSHKFPKISSPVLMLFILSATIASARMYLVKAERDADLLQKTPEELLKLLKTNIIHTGRVFFPTPIMQLILNSKECPSFLQEQRSLSKKLTIPHALRHKRIEYCAHQFEKQVNNPGFDDFPRSEQECKKALSCYFYNEKDYATGKPYIDHPLIHKRVALLREHLKWHQSKEA